MVELGMQAAELRGGRWRPRIGDSVEAASTTASALMITGVAGSGELYR